MVEWLFVEVFLPSYPTFAAITVTKKFRHVIMIVNMNVNFGLDALGDGKVNFGFDVPGKVHMFDVMLVLAHGNVPGRMFMLSYFVAYEFCSRGCDDSLLLRFC